MEFMKKICLLFIAAALALLGLMAYNNYRNMSTSKNVAVQGWNPTKSSDWKKANFTNSCGKSADCKSDEWCSASQCKKKKNYGAFCDHKSECQSGKCNKNNAGSTMCS